MKSRALTYLLMLFFAVVSTAGLANDELVKKTFHASYHTFTLVTNLIVVQAELGGIQGNYIFDTGSSGLVLNADYQIKESSNTVEIIGATHSVRKAEKTRIESFRFGNIVKRNFTAASLSLSHIEASMSMRIDGLIGMDVLQEAAIIIDYEAQLITLTDPNDDYESANAKLDIHFVSNIPVIDAEINGHSIALAIDFGATSSIIDQTIARQLDLKIVEQVDLITSSGLIETLDKVQFDKIRLDGSFEFQTNAIAVDLSHLQSEDQAIQGIVGLDLLQSGKVMINPSKSKLYIWSE